MTSHTRRATLRGWWKFLPFIVLPASTIFVEAWLNTQILKNQYTGNGLLAELREVRIEANLLRDRKHHLERMERIHAEASDLGLIQPSPGQFEVIVSEETDVEAYASDEIAPLEVRAD